MPQILGLELVITAENADEVIAKLKTLGATARGETTEGVSALDTATQSLTSTLRELGLALGVGELLRKTWEAANEGELATNRLASAFANLGLNVDHFTTLIGQAEAPILRFGTLTESQLNLALGNMIQRTQDVRGSLEHLNIVAGLAASGQFDLQSAAILVSRAMEGQWIMLNRSFPSLKNATDKWAELNRITESFLKDQAGTLDGQLQRIGARLAVIAEHFVEAAGGATTLKGAVDNLMPYLDALERWAIRFEIGVERMFKLLGLLIDTIMHPLESLKQMGAALKDIFTGNWPDLIGAAPTGAHRMPTVNIGPNTGPAAAQATSAPGAMGAGAELLQAWPWHAAPAFMGSSFIDQGMPADTMNTINAMFTRQTTAVSGMGATGGQTTEDSNTRMKQLLDMWKQYQKQVDESQKVTDAMTSSISEAWGRMFQSMSEAMTRAFEGKKVGNVFKELGQSILQGFGQMFQEQGAALLQYGVIMLGLMPLLSNPFTSGPAAIAAGIALEALGAAFNAIASSGAAPGSGSSGGAAQGQVSPHGVSSTSYLLPTGGQPFAAGEKYPGLVAPVFNVIGTGDPRAQRDIMTLLQKAVGRGYSAPGIAGT